jgi:hypothetical protein
MSDDADQLLDIPEVVDIMGLSGNERGGIETVRKWCRTGELKGVKLGGRAGWRVRRGDLREFMAKRSVRAAVEKAVGA